MDHQLKNDTVPGLLGLAVLHTLTLENLFHGLN